MILPETDYLLNIDDMATRLDKSTNWARNISHRCHFTFSQAENCDFLRAGSTNGFTIRAPLQWPALPLDRTQYAR